VTGGPVPVRADLAELMPYGAPQLDVPVRLNTNETAEPPPPGFLSEVARRIQDLELNRYPDRRATDLRTALGRPHGLGPERVWAANGSNEILQQLLQAYGGPGRRVVVTRPGYSMYASLAQVMLTEFVEHDLSEDFVVGDHDAAAMAELDGDVTIITNPNNPTGLPVTLDVVRELHDRCRGLVVVDEAYVEFGGTSAVSLLSDCERLVVVRTFSKAFRLAGLRLGYLLAHDWVIDDLRRVRLPYHLDAIKQVAGLVALDQQDLFLEHRSRVSSERNRILTSLRTLPGVTAFDSDANFVLFRVSDARATFEGLLAQGVLVRDFSAKPRLDGCLRVTVGTHDENNAFLTALKETFDERATGA
jgi:histidinol-phosphate aminotransferase